MDRYDFNQQLADAARAIAGENNTEDTLERVVQTALELVGSADLAGLSVFASDGVHTPAATHEDHGRIDQLQYQLAEGPCLDALRETDVIRIGNVATDSRWTRWGPAIGEEYDIRSALAFHLFTDGQQLAAMTLYARKPDSFDHEDVVDGLAVAAQAAVTLAATTNHDQMNQAMRNRQVIGEAIGMLRERFNLSSGRAFEVLKRLSSHHNAKVALIAQHVVDTGDLPEPPDREGLTAPRHGEALQRASERG